MSNFLANHNNCYVLLRNLISVDSVNTSMSLYRIKREDGELNARGICSLTATTQISTSHYLVTAEATELISDVKL